MAREQRRKYTNATDDTHKVCTSLDEDLYYFIDRLSAEGPSTCK
jgi:hypothetical protein